MSNGDFTSGERLYLAHAETSEEVLAHKSRYQLALETIAPGAVVVDAACGSGYGSEMLAKKASKVLGLEISADALAYARDHHSRDNIDFVQADLSQPLQLPDALADAVVSFETLEHLSNQRQLLADFSRILKPGGRLIISSPDRTIVTEQAHIPNPFHIAELSKSEFLSLLDAHFSVDALFGQMRYVPTSGWKGLIKAIVTRTGIGELAVRVVKRLGMRERVVKAFAERDISASGEFDPLRPDDPSEHFILVALATRR